MSSRAKPKQRNRYEKLQIEPLEPDESVESTGADSHAHRTRNKSLCEDSSAQPHERLETALKQAIHIIDSIPSTAEWWTLASNRLLDALRPALLLVTSTSPAQLGFTPDANASNLLHSVHDVLPGPTSPDVSLQSTLCPLPLTVHDVEAAVARALPAVLQSELARGLKDIRDTIQAGRGSSSGDAQWTRAPTCCSPTHQADPLPKPPPPPNERDVIVTLANVPSTDPAHALSELEVKALVDSKIAVTAPPGAPPAVHGVKKLANGTLRIRTTSENVRDALVKAPDGWLHALGAGAQLARDRFAVEVRAVPTTFYPGEDCATQVVFQANAGVIPAATSIVSMRWLREPSSDKATSSLIIEFDTVKTFSSAIYYGISMRGRMCDVVPFIPPPTQCYFCQGWGHTISACPRKKTNLPIICARCAGPHATGACSCPHNPRCSSLRRCSHIVVKCANCGERHKSFSVDCQARRRAAAEVARQPRYARLLAAYSSSPPQPGPVAASDIRRSLSFSSSPRAGSAWRD